MSDSPAFYAYWTDRFIAATASWTPAEVGAYQRLLNHQAVHGSLPADPSRLARITGMDLDEFQAAWVDVLEEKFVKDPKNPKALLNERMAEERERAISNSASALEKSMKGVKAREEKRLAELAASTGSTTGATPGKTRGSTPAQPTQTQTQTQNNTPPKSAQARGGAEIPSEGGQPKARTSISVLEAIPSWGAWAEHESQLGRKITGSQRDGMVEECLRVGAVEYDARLRYSRQAGHGSVCVPPKAWRDADAKSEPGGHTGPQAKPREMQGTSSANAPDMDAWGRIRATVNAAAEKILDGAPTEKEARLRVLGDHRAELEELAGMDLSFNPARKDGRTGIQIRPSAHQSDRAGA